MAPLTLETTASLGLPELGSGAEALSAGAPLATGSGAAGSTPWLSAAMAPGGSFSSSLPTLAQTKNALQLASLTSGLGSAGSALLNPPKPPSRPSPMTQQPSAGAWKGPTSAPLMQMLAERMAARKMPPLRF